MNLGGHNLACNIFREMLRALNERMEMKEPPQTCHAQVPPQTLVVCFIMCRSVNVNRYSQGDFVAPTCLFSKSGYTLGQKAAMMEWTQPRMCHQETQAPISATPLSDWGTAGEPLHWSQLQCLHLHTGRSASSSTLWGTRG